MNLEKLFGSKTKVDILKYLIFKRQGVSMRALEAELERTFPAIKKQVDSLEESEVLKIEKSSSGRSISLYPEFSIFFKDIFYLKIKSDLEFLFREYGGTLVAWYWGDRFGKQIGSDLVLIYQDLEKKDIDKLKADMNIVFRSFWIETVSVVFMSKGERDRRYRLADRFVLQVMRYYNGN